MGMKPKLEVKQYHGDGKRDYAIFRSDRIKPICKGITQAHADHLKIILGRMADLPESFPPIKNWYDYDDIVDIDESGYGKPKQKEISDI